MMHCSTTLPAGAEGVPCCHGKQRRQHSQLSKKGIAMQSGKPRADEASKGDRSQLTQKNRVFVPAVDHPLRRFQSGRAHDACPQQSMRATEQRSAHCSAVQQALHGLCRSAAACGTRLHHQFASTDVQFPHTHVIMTAAVSRAGISKVCLTGPSSR